MLSIPSLEWPCVESNVVNGNEAGCVAGVAVVRSDHSGTALELC